MNAGYNPEYLEQQLVKVSPEIREYILKMMEQQIQRRDGATALPHPLEQLHWDFTSQTARNPEEVAQVSDSDLRILTGICLYQLDLSYTRITDSGFFSLSDTSIRILSLEGTSITNDGVRKFVERVRDLKPAISNSDLEAAGLSEFGSNQLVELDLSHTRITDEALHHLSQLPNLVMLGLSGTQVGDEGMQQVSRLQKLKCLLLRKTGISDAALQHVGQLPDLEVLDLTDTQVSDKGLRHLVKLKKLKVLGLAATDADTMQGHEALARMDRLDYLTLSGRTSSTPEIANSRSKHLPLFFPYDQANQTRIHPPAKLRRDALELSDEVRGLLPIHDMSISSTKDGLLVLRRETELDGCRYQVLSVDLLHDRIQKVLLEDLPTLFIPNDFSHTPVHGNAKWLAAASTLHPKQVTIWKLLDTVQGRATKYRTVDAPWPVAALAFSSDRSQLVLARRPSDAEIIQREPLRRLQLAVVNIESGKMTPSEITTEKDLPIADGVDYDSIAISPDGHTLALSNLHGEAIADLKSGKAEYVIRRFTADEGTHTFMGHIELDPYFPSRRLELGADFMRNGSRRHRFSADSKWLFSNVKLSNDKLQVLIYDLQARRFAAQLPGTLVTMSQDSSVVGTARENGGNNLTIWRFKDGVPERINQIQEVGDAVLSDDGKLVVTRPGYTGKLFGVWELPAP